MREVRLGSWSKVLPLEQEEELHEIKVVPLSPLDNSMFYATSPKKVLFFDRAGEDAPSILKQSLAKTLALFHPFAGRISFKVPHVQLQLHRINAGAAFVEATTSCTVAELGSEILPSEFTDRLCQMEIQPEYPWKEEYPLLSVQVTRFSCGGLSVGVSFSHQVCDGVGFWYFMSSWTEAARLGAPLSAPKLSYEIEEPERSPRDHLRGTMVTTSRRDVVRTLRSTRSEFELQADSLATTLVRLSKAKLTELKTLVPPGCTTFAVTCAFFWQIIARTWDAPGDGEAARLLVLVNCREKTPWLSSNYFGNAVIGAAVRIGVEQLRSGSLASVARLIHQGISESCTRDSIEETIRAVHAYDGDEETMLFPETTDCTRLMLVVGSPRHPIYELDFGWGRACNSTFGTNDLGPNKIFLFPSPPQGDDGAGVDAILSLDPGSMPVFLFGVNQSP